MRARTLASRTGGTRASSCWKTSIPPWTGTCRSSAHACRSWVRQPGEPIRTATGMRGRTSRHQTRGLRDPGQQQVSRGRPRRLISTLLRLACSRIFRGHESFTNPDTTTACGRARGGQGTPSSSTSRSEDGQPLVRPQVPVEAPVERTDAALAAEQSTDAALRRERTCSWKRQLPQTPRPVRRNR